MAALLKTDQAVARNARVAAIHHVESTGFCRQDIQHVHVVQPAVADVDGFDVAQALAAQVNCAKAMARNCSAHDKVRTFALPQ
jgi:hypothetical protein